MSGMQDGGEERNDTRTLRGRDYPSVRQFSIFSPNRVGQLLGLSNLMETSRLRVHAISIAESSDCAIIRLVVSEPERAYELLTAAGYSFCEVDLLIVELPDRSHPIGAICSQLLHAEINIHYSYPMLIQPRGRPALAFCIENLETASKVLTAHGFTLLTENDLSD